MIVDKANSHTDQIPFVSFLSQVDSRAPSRAAWLFCAWFFLPVPPQTVASDVSDLILGWAWAPADDAGSRCQLGVMEKPVNPDNEQTLLCWDESKFARKQPEGLGSFCDLGQ